MIMYEINSQTGKRFSKNVGCQNNVVILTFPVISFHSDFKLNLMLVIYTQNTFSL